MDGRNVDVQYINPFVLSTKAVFETMVGSKVRVGKPMVKHDAVSVADVSGVIGFSGDAVGCVVVSFPISVACKAASAFAGIEIDADHADFADAIGELANMVAGGAKKEFHGMDISISLPSVIIGKEHVVSQSKQTPHVVIPCETDFGQVFVEIGMTVEKAGSGTPATKAGVAV
jgi:chemotaxis protein CheX